MSDDLLAGLRVLNGRDVDLATDANRAVNRCRDALVAVSPALERAIGEHLNKPGVRDLLAKWSTPTELRTKIRSTIRKRSPRLAAKLTDAVMRALDAQSIVLPAESAWGEVIGGPSRRPGADPCLS